MQNSEFFKNYKSFVSFRPDRYGKSTLFENEHILVGVNCLEPGQEMGKHAHEVQCRFYVVLEGDGLVWVGDEMQATEIGTVISVPAGHPHRILNIGTERMVLLVGITPPHAD
jgi:quercetin dioxygenase-like cupin family protein